MNYLASEYEMDKSGIHTLGGFSYQIRVFAFYLSKLVPDMQLEFETYDDLATRKINSDSIDINEDQFKNKVITKNSIEAIQVKRTKLSNATALKVLMNWILLESSSNNVSKYTLFTKDEYNNTNNLFHLSAEELFLKIDSAKLEKKPKSTIGKLKKQFTNNKQLFFTIYNSVETKTEFISIENIDEKIKEAYDLIFRRSGLNSEIVYVQRIKALLQKLTFDILEKVNSKNSYSMTYPSFSKLLEKITLEIGDETPMLDFIDFKQSCIELDINDKSISNTREYAQLKECELPPRNIKNHIVYMLYYGRFRLLNVERNNVEKIEVIEDTTYDNFFMAKQKLKKFQEDSPFLRLDETKNRSNNYTHNEQLKWGSAIYLTKDKTDEDLKISWKDE